MEEKRTEMFAESIQKTKLYSEDDLSDRRTQTKYTVEKWSWVFGLDSTGLRYLSVKGYKTFSLQKGSLICFTICELLITMVH